MRTVLLETSNGLPVADPAEHAHDTTATHHTHPRALRRNAAVSMLSIPVNRTSGRQPHTAGLKSLPTFGIGD
jgi:hypothetical protein